MDSDLAWVNGKSGRQSCRYADAFQLSIISEAIYHFTHIKGKAKVKQMIYIAVLCNPKITAEPLYNTPLFIGPNMPLPTIRRF